MICTKTFRYVYLILIFYICDSTFDTLTVSLGNTNETKKTFKALLLRVHPDKHPGDERATRICQDVKTFYDDCLASTPARKKKKPSSYTHGSSPNSMGYALEFNVANRWSHIQYDYPYVLPQMTSHAVSVSISVY